MLPKIASALARVLEPIRAIDRPGEALATAKSSKGDEGGHGPLGYSGPDTPPPEEEKGEEKEAPEDSEDPVAVLGPVETKEEYAERAQNDPDPETQSFLKKKGPSLPLQPGLTQVILDLSSQRQEKLAEGLPASTGSSLTSYEIRAKEQKKASRLPKGSMLDKKVA